MLKKRQNRGDTLIEVLFAVTIFSMIVVGALALMNQGLSASQRALETTQVRQQIDGQAEALRYIHGAYVATYQKGAVPKAGTVEYQWNEIIQKSLVTKASKFGANSGVTCVTPPAKSFVIDTKTAQYRTGSAIFVKPATIAQLTYNSSSVMRSEGLWIEAVRSSVSSDPNQAGMGYIDFHIRACWDAPGLNRPMNLGTIVRLYEPR